MERGFAVQHRRVDEGVAKRLKIIDKSIELHEQHVQALEHGVHYAAKAASMAKPRGCISRDDTRAPMRAHRAAGVAKHEFEPRNRGADPLQ